jgi:hypothetical protein
MSLPTIRTPPTERRGKIPNTPLSPKLLVPTSSLNGCPRARTRAPHKKNSTSVTLKKRATLAEGLGGNLKQLPLDKNRQQKAREMSQAQHP